jgi:C-terminal processing protease CtpA/Prc
MKTTFRFPLARTAYALLAVFLTGSIVFGDEPAENAAKSEAVKVAEDLERQLQDLRMQERLRAHYDVQYAQLATSGEALIGVQVSAPDEVLRSHLGLAEGRGLVVTSVADGGPAAQGGIQINDVLIAVGDEEIDGADRLRQLLEASKDKPVSIALIRAGQRQKVELTPHAGAIQLGLQFLTLQNTTATTEEPKYWLGVGLAGADDALRSHLGIAAGEGLIVTGIENDSPAAKAGLMTNDLLLKLDGKPLKTIEELSAQLQEIKDKSVSLELLRRGKPASLTVIPELRPRFDEAMKLAVDLAHDNAVITFALSQDAKVLAEQTLIGRIEKAAGAVEQADLSPKVNELVAQAKQLQASLEALQAAMSPKDQPPQSDK